MEKKLQLNQLGETLVHSRLDQEMRHLPHQILAANACYFGSADLQVGYHQPRPEQAPPWRNACYGPAEAGDPHSK